MNIQELINSFARLLAPAILAIIGLALLFFLFHLAVFILKAGDDEARKKAKAMMVWGIVALFIMVSIWGIVRLLQGEFGISAVNF